MTYKDILIRLASMTIPYVYDDEVSFLELDRKLYKIVHELIVAMQGLSTDYENLKDYIFMKTKRNPMIIPIIMEV